MYIRTVNAATNKAELQQLVHDHPLGVLTTVIDGTPDHPLLQHTHIPWLLDSDRGDGGKGVLRGHMARSNPQAKQLLELHRSRKGEGGDDLAATHVTVLFTHDTHAYITPRFYVATKPATAKVVPTWNYAAVEVRGRLRVDESYEFLRKQVDDLTRHQEPRSLGGKASGFEDAERHAGWNVADAPPAYVTALSKAIVGIEITIESMVGTFKMSQDKPEQDRQGIIDGFAAYGTDDGQRMADMVQERAAAAAARR